MSSHESNIDLLFSNRAPIDQALSRQGPRSTLFILEAVAPPAYFRSAESPDKGKARDLHADLCAEIIAEFQGTIASSAGDALAAVFKEPAAAARAGARIQRRLSYINQFLPEEERVEFRVGIHSGGMGRSGKDMLTAASVAARITKGSGPAQILISSSTLGEFVLDEDLRCNWIGRLQSEVDSRPEEIFEIVWTDSSAYRELRLQVTAWLEQGKLVCSGGRAADLFDSSASTAEPGDSEAETLLDVTLAPWQISLPKRYEILGELGKGGMGVVYKAHDRETGEIVALKVLRPEIAGDPAGIERFKNELRLARRVTHRNVCRIYDFNRAGNTAFITMEFIDGVTLHDHLRARGRLSADEGTRIARQICSALREAHSQGIIHRDLKPTNIMLDRTGSAKIMDFGIARSIDSSLTTAGMVLGTPAYMAPEQAEGRTVDARTDVYLLGLILYEVLTGAVAFTGDTPFLIALKQMREFPPPPREIEPNLPDYIEKLVMRCLQKNPALRFQSVDEFEETLARGQSST